MTKNILIETLNKLESSLFRELFFNNKKEAEKLLKKQESILKFDKSVRWLLKDINSLGLSKRIIETLKNRGIDKILDLVYLKPLRVEDYTFKNPKEIKNGDYVAIKGIVVSKNRGNRVLSLIVNVQGMHIRCNWFNITPYLRKLIKSINLGDELVFLGKIIVDGFIRQLNHPKIENPKDFDEFKKIVYPSVGNLRNSTIQKVISQALEIAPKKPYEWLPYSSIVKNDLCFFSETLEQMHTAGNFDNIDKRLKYEELFLLLLALKLQEKKLKSHTAPSITVNKEFLKEIKKTLPFQLTNGQAKALEEILNDLKNDRPMLKLLQGDVGCGKTIVSLIAALIVVKNGYQTAIMAPTQPLAIQFFEQAKSLFEKFGYSVELLISPTKNKKKIYKQLKNGEINCIVGTHSLLQENVEFKKLGFIVIDEQHRFGVEQRKTLSKKGSFPHVLIMSATPIPRSLSMILYSKTSLSTIKEKPKNRGKLKTLHFFKKDSRKAYKIAIEEIRKKHQVYVIAPLIEESEHFENVEAARKLFESLKSTYFKNFKISLLHGKLKSEDKEKMILEFKEGKIDCLVSTTVVEVGIDSPNATVIIVENAERFGLSQLHQLRGRVGRSNLDSYAIFITDNKLTDNARKRVRALLKTNDGFEIAEMDFKLRGSGEILGVKQHGRDLVYTDIIKDKELIKSVKGDVETLIEKDYPFSEGLLKIMNYKWEKRFNYINVG